MGKLQPQGRQLSQDLEKLGLAELEKSHWIPFRKGDTQAKLVLTGLEATIICFPPVLLSVL